VSWKDRTDLLLRDAEYDPLPEQQIDESLPEPWDRADYHSLVSKSSAYEWLLGRLRVELKLIPTGPNTMESIRTTILASLLPVWRISDKRPPQPAKASFEMDWDPIGFIAEQDYLLAPEEVIETALTLTGTLEDAQATTCVEYLRQTWPRTGEHTLQLVKLTLQSGIYNEVQCRCPYPLYLAPPSTIPHFWHTYDSQVPQW
jgi:hypothetical protein